MRNPSIGTLLRNTCGSHASSWRSKLPSVELTAWSLIFAPFSHEGRAIFNQIEKGERHQLWQKPLIAANWAEKAFQARNLSQLFVFFINIQNSRSLIYSAPTESHKTKLDWMWFHELYLIRFVGTLKFPHLFADTTSFPFGWLSPPMDGWRHFDLAQLNCVSFAPSSGTSCDANVRATRGKFLIDDFKRLLVSRLTPTPSKIFRFDTRSDMMFFQSNAL